MKYRHFDQFIKFIFYTFIVYSTPAYPTDSHNIVVFGDFGENNQEIQLRIRDSISELNSLDPLWHGIFLGDNFYPNGVRSTDDPQFLSKIVNIYQELNLPFLAALGNHDHLGDINAQISFTKLAQNPYVRGSSKLWTMFGSVYSRRWEEPNLEVFVLDTEMADPKSEATQRHLRMVQHLAARDRNSIPTRSWKNQMEWLEKQLKNSKAKWKFVVAHHPIVSDIKRNQFEINHCLHENYQSFKNILVKHAHLYISAHDHSLQVHQIESQQDGHGPLQIISGSGGTSHTIKKFDGNSSIYRADPGSHGYIQIRLSKKAVEIIPKIVTDSGTEEGPIILRNFDDFAISLPHSEGEDVQDSENFVEDLPDV